MLFEKVQKTGPGWASLKGAPRQIIAECTEITDEYALVEDYVLNRYASSSDASSNTSPTEIYRGAGRVAHDRDNGFVVGTPYYYRWYYVDEYGNPSTFSSTLSITYTGLVTADVADGAITDPKTSSTAPATPSSANLMLSQYQKRDKDGTIHNYVKAAFNTTGYGSKTRFAIAVNDGVNAVYAHENKTGKFQFPCEVAVTYSITVTAIAFNDVPSSPSGAVTITPVKKPADLPAPTGLAITQDLKGLIVSINDVDTDTYPDYEQTCWYSQAAATPVPTPGTTPAYKKNKASTFVDRQTAYGTTWFYFAALRDTSGGFSPVAGPVSAAPVQAQTADYAAGSVTKVATTTTVPATPSAGTLHVSQDPRNTQGDGTVTMTAKIWADSLPTNAETIVFNVDYSYPAGTDVRPFPAGKDLSAIIPITYGQTIGITYYGVGFNGNKGAAIATAVTLTPAAKSGLPADPTNFTVLGGILSLSVTFDPSTDTDYEYSELAFLSAPGTPSSTDVIARVIGDCTIYFLSFGTYYFYLRHVNTSGKQSNWVSNFFSAQTIIRIQAPYIDANQINSYAVASNNVNQACAAGTKTLAQSTSITLANSPNLVETFTSFRNNSGGTRTMDISIEDSGGNILLVYANVTLADNEYFSGDADMALPTNSTFRVYITMTTAGSVIRTRLHVRLRSR